MASSARSAEAPRPEGDRPSLLAFNDAGGVDPGCRPRAPPTLASAVTDLGGQPLAERDRPTSPIAPGPETGPRLACAILTALLRCMRIASDGRRPRHRDRSPGARRVLERASRFNPPIMPGWDGFSIPELLRRRATRRPCSSTTTSTSWRSASTGRDGATGEHLLFVKVGTGIGCGVVAGGSIHRGARGRRRRHRPHPDQPTTTTCRLPLRERRLPRGCRWRRRARRCG